MLKTMKNPCENEGVNCPCMRGNVEKCTPRKNRVKKTIIFSDEFGDRNCPCMRERVKKWTTRKKHMPKCRILSEENPDANCPCMIGIVEK